MRNMLGVLMADRYFFCSVWCFEKHSLISSQLIQAPEVIYFVDENEKGQEL